MREIVDTKTIGDWIVTEGLSQLFKLETGNKIHAHYLEEPDDKFLAFADKIRDSLDEHHLKHEKSLDIRKLACAVVGDWLERTKQTPHKAVFVGTEEVLRHWREDASFSVRPPEVIFNEPKSKRTPWTKTAFPQP